MQKRPFRTSLSMVLAMCATALFLCTTSAVAQETTPFLTQIRNLTPKQQINYALEARKRGDSLLQLEGLAKAQGANPEELSLLRTARSDSQTGRVGEGLKENLQDVETQSWYKGYKGLIRVDLDDPDETAYRPFNGSGEVVAYRGGLMLTYKIPTFATKNNLDE